MTFPGGGMPPCSVGSTSLVAPLSTCSGPGTARCNLESGWDLETSIEGTTSLHSASDLLPVGFSPPLLAALSLRDATQFAPTLLGLPPLRHSDVAPHWAWALPPETELSEAPNSRHLPPLPTGVTLPARSPLSFGTGDRFPRLPVSVDFCLC